MPDAPLVIPDAPLVQASPDRERIAQYAADRWLCLRCGRPLEYHRDGFACRERRWWLTEPGLRRRS